MKEGVAVIDVGINRVKDEATGKYKLVGDVDFEGEKLRESGLILEWTQSRSCTGVS